MTDTEVAAANSSSGSVIITTLQNNAKYIMIAIAIVLVILLIYNTSVKKKGMKGSNKKEGYNKNRGERDDPQGDWSLADKIKEINIQQDSNF